MEETHVTLSGTSGLYGFKLEECTSILDVLESQNEVAFYKPSRTNGDGGVGTNDGAMRVRSLTLLLLLDELDVESGVFMCQVPRPAKNQSRFFLNQVEILLSSRRTMSG